MNVAWPHGDPRTVAKAVLADRRYHTAPQAAAPKSLWDLLWEAVGRWLDALLKPLGHVFGNNPFTELLGFAVLAVVLGLLVAGALYFLRPLFAQHRARAARVAASALAADGDAATLRARARAAADAGRYRDAATLLWASALRALDELGRVRYDPARTPGEWRRAVRESAFDTLARDAVVALFGDRAVDAALVARMTSAYDAVIGTR